MTKRCLDTHFYVDAHKVASGTTYYVDPQTGEQLTVICGRRRARPGQIHVKDLAAGAQLFGVVGSEPVLFDPAYSKGHRGAKEPGQATVPGLNKNSIRRSSTHLSWLLRHGANEAGLSMSTSGWASVTDVLSVTGLTKAELESTVEHSNKNRLEVRGNYIRACQGHSTAGTPVSGEALEESWARVSPEESLWHSTRVAALGAIAQEGLVARDRTHVHMSAARDSNVGKRASNEILLEISPKVLLSRGCDVFRATNGVLLTRRVPREAIIGVCAMDQARELDAQNARVLLGLGE
jgi:putative RNA 2'-phosphotransferase